MLQYRNLTTSDVAAVRELVHACTPLDLHTPFTYWVLANFFPHQCFVAEDDGRLVGFISSISHAEGIFIWQVGVLPSQRRQGVASHLIGLVTAFAYKERIKRVQVSIAPENEASFRTFQRHSQAIGLPLNKIGSLNISDTLEGLQEFEHIYGWHL